MNKLIKKIESKAGVENILDNISENISGSELNSFLLELFRKRSAQFNPSNILQEYGKNWFCFPSIVDPIKIKKEEIDWLENGSEYGFQPILISPLTPFGTVNSVALVDQNNIVVHLEVLK